MQGTRGYGGLIIQGAQAAHNNSRRIIYLRYYFGCVGFSLTGSFANTPISSPIVMNPFYLQFRIFPIPKSRYTRTFLSNTSAHHQYIVPLLVQEKE